MCWIYRQIHSQIKISHFPGPMSVIRYSFHWLFFTTSMSSCLILQLTLPSSVFLTVWRPSVSCNKCGWCLMSEPKSLLVDTRRSRVHYFDVGAVMSWLAVILCNVLVRIINIHTANTAGQEIGYNFRSEKSVQSEATPHTTTRHSIGQPGKWGAEVRPHL